MSIINKIENTAQITYDGNTITSLPTETLLLVLPTILKTVDKPIASIGEDLNYTITVANLGLTTISDIDFSDAIPEGSTYVEGSFKVDGSPVTPTVESDTISYTIPSIGILGNKVITFQVHIVGGETV